MIARRRGRTRRSGRVAVALAWCLLFAVVAVNAAFKDAGIAIPSPQRDVTIRFPPREET